MYSVGWETCALNSKASCTVCGPACTAGILGWHSHNAANPLGLLCCLCCAGLPAAILQTSGSKAQVAARLLDAFGLKAATSMPARLLQVVKLERGFKHARYLAWDGPNAVDVHRRVNVALSQMARAGQQPWPSRAYSFQVREGCKPGSPKRNRPEHRVVL